MTVKKINIILLLIFILLSFNSKCFASFPDDPHNLFDSSNCKGYNFFKIKGIHFDSTSNLKLYNEIYGWIGVPYRYGGRSKTGADCSGFASQIYTNVYNIYISGSAGSIYNMLKPIDKSELKEGDLVFFKINHSYISHVGIYLSNNKFIHATSWGKSIRISSLDEPYYMKYYFSAGRFEQKENDSTEKTTNK